MFIALWLVDSHDLSPEIPVDNFIYNCMMPFWFDTHGAQILKTQQD